MANETRITRLSRYRDSLIRLKSLNFVKVFSENLADAARVTAVQVRKDFSLFGISGNRRGGYVVDELISQLDVVLGKNEVQRFIVVGVGNIGRAMLNYSGFGNNEIEVVAGFDIDESKHDRDSDVPVMPLDEMAGFAKKNKIRFGIIAVPDFAAQQILEMVLDAGIRGVLNFAPICLREPEGCVVRNLSFATELENIIYFTNIAVKAKDEKDGCQVS